MLKMVKMFEPEIDYTEIMLERIKNEYAVKDINIDWGTCYEVTIQDIRFKCAYSDDEMRGIIDTCVKIIQELIVIQDNGYTRERFDSIDHFDNGEEVDTILAPLEVFADFKTDKLSDYVADLAGYTRVGGAWYMLLSGPCIKDTIYAVFDKMLDDPDDMEIWVWLLHFLIRGAMKMHGQEITNNDIAKT